MAEKEVPVGVGTGGDLRHELAESSLKNGDEVPRNVMSEVALRRAVMLKVEEAERIGGLHISPLDVMEKNGVIHDFTLPTISALRLKPEFLRYIEYLCSLIQY